MTFRDFIGRIGTLGNVLLPIWVILLMVDFFRDAKVSIDLIMAIIVFGVVFGDEMDEYPYRSRFQLILTWAKRIALFAACFVWIPLAFYLVDTIGEDSSFKRSMIAPILVSFLSMLWIVYIHISEKDANRSYKKLLIKRVIDELNPFYGNEHDHKVFLIGSMGADTDIQERIVRAAVHDGIKIWSVASPGGHAQVHAYMAACKRDPFAYGDNQGFVTSHGRFVDREEGLKIAQAASQIKHKHPSHRELYSEDMWKLSDL